MATPRTSAAKPAAKKPVPKAAPAKAPPAKAKAASGAAPGRAVTAPPRPAAKAPPAKAAPKPATRPAAAKAPPARAASTPVASHPAPPTPPQPAASTAPAPKPAAPTPAAPTKAAPDPVTTAKTSTAPKQAARKPAPKAEAAPEAPPAPRPSIIIAAPTGPARPGMGRPGAPPSFAVRGPGRPGFAEGQAAAPRPPGPKVDLKAGDHVVYPTHGVGTVQGIEVIEAAGVNVSMVVVTFEENRMTLRVPVNKVPTAGLRLLFTPKEFEAAIDTLKGKARIKRTMWSRRAQEYEAKINSGDPVAIAEVVRDLQRNAGQPDQSFSERQIYEQALERLAAEYAAIEKIDKHAASEKLVEFAKSS